MVQTAKETVDAIIEDDNKHIQKILEANKERKDLYWIVLFLKPSKVLVNGHPALMKLIKPYGRKPESQVGMVCGEVDNKKGSVNWEVNMPQIPFDFERLPGAKTTNRGVVETSTIPNAYFTK